MEGDNSSQRTRHGNGRGGNTGHAQNNRQGNNPNKVNNRRGINRGNPSRRNNIVSDYDDENEDLDGQGDEEVSNAANADRLKKEQEEKKKKNNNKKNGKKSNSLSDGSTTTEESSSSDGEAVARIPKAVKIKIAIAIIIIVLFLALIAVIAAFIAALFGGIDDTGKLESLKCDTINMVFCRKVSSDYVLEEGEQYCDEVLPQYGIDRGRVSKRYIYNGTGSADFEKYVAGVVESEVAAVCNKCNNKEEVLKAFAVAARSTIYVRAHTGNNCYVEVSDRFQGYVPPTSKSIKAARDTKDEVLVDNDGNVMFVEFDAIACYGKEVDENGETWYLIKQPVLTGDRIPLSWLKEKNPHLLSHDDTGWLICDGILREHHGRGASQYGSYYIADTLNYDYKEILYYYYEAYTDGTYKLVD